MRQKTFSSLGFEVHGKQTRRQRFLDEMDMRAGPIHLNSFPGFLSEASAMG